MHQLSVSARRIWSDSICGGQFLHLSHKYSYHFVPNKRFKLHKMGFQRRLVPRKRFRWNENLTGEAHPSLLRLFPRG